jgi:hypothetical protein
MTENLKLVLSGVGHFVDVKAGAGGEQFVVSAAMSP